MYTQDETMSGATSGVSNWGDEGLDLGGILIDNTYDGESSTNQDVTQEDNNVAGIPVDTSTGRVQKVIFNKVGGQGGTDYIDAVFGQPMPKAVAPTKLGFLFRGYWTARISLNWEYDKADGAMNQMGVQFYDGESGGGGIMTSVRDWFLYENDGPNGEKSDAYPQGYPELHAMWERIGPKPNSGDIKSGFSDIGTVMWVVAFLVLGFVIIGLLSTIIFVRKRRAKLRQNYYGYIQPSRNNKNNDWW
jgi:hypothetical protein